MSQICNLEYIFFNLACIGTTPGSIIGSSSGVSGETFFLIAACIGSLGDRRVICSNQVS